MSEWECERERERACVCARVNGPPSVLWGSRSPPAPARRPLPAPHRIRRRARAWSSSMNFRSAAFCSDVMTDRAEPAAGPPLSAAPNGGRGGLNAERQWQLPNFFFKTGTETATHPRTGGGGKATHFWGSIPGQFFSVLHAWIRETHGGGVSGLPHQKMEFDRITGPVILSPSRKGVNVFFREQFKWKIVRENIGRVPKKQKLAGKSSDRRIS